MATAAGAATMDAAAAMRYNAALKYAASRPDYLGGQGLLNVNKSIPYNKILKGSALKNLGEGGLGYLDGAMAQGLLAEAEAA